MTGKDVAKAANFLKEGKLVSIPTETVYGLGANALNDKAVAQIYEVKKRPNFNPLIIHSFSVKELEKYVCFSDQAKALAKKFWPGPLTLVLPKRNSLISEIATCGLDTIAVRIPDNRTTLKLLKKCNLPIAAPSANMSGRVSPTCANDVDGEIGHLIAYVVDGGPCEVGIESTIISLTDEPTILRPGAITQKMIENIIGVPVKYAEKNSKIVAPGMMKKHYSPNLKVEINISEPRDGFAFIGFGKMPFETTLNLSESGELSEAAANLFKFFRLVDDSSKYKGILVSEIPADGIGYAINDRLARAAAK